MSNDIGISRHVTYRLAEFMKLIGIDKAGVRSLRRKGLRVRYCGRSCFVTGEDWVEFLRTCPTESPTISRLSSPR
jgi:hypothetical protein